MNSYTKAGMWLERHGWKLDHTKPHGYATTHYWENPHDGLLYTQSYALIEQRRINSGLPRREYARLPTWNR